MSLFFRQLIFTIHAVLWIGFLIVKNLLLNRSVRTYTSTQFGEGFCILTKIQISLLIYEYTKIGLERFVYL